MTGLVGYLVLFVIIGVGFVFINLMIGKLVRPSKPSAEKSTIYECGEPTIGSAWIQFDLRFYVVALLFVIFDVEVVFFFPWAVVFGKANQLSRADLPADTRQVLSDELVPAPERSVAGRSSVAVREISAPVARQLAWIAFWDIAVFFAILLVGFAYLWKRGDLDWVRSTLAERQVATKVVSLPTNEQGELVGAGQG